VGEWVAADFIYICISFTNMCSPIAQLVEQMAVNHRVAGSSPARGAIFLGLAYFNLILIKVLQGFCLVYRTYLII
jgi:hypothetical protein